jgi:hypothetical protein
MLLQMENLLLFGQLFLWFASVTEFRVAPRVTTCSQVRSAVFSTGTKVNPGFFLFYRNCLHLPVSVSMGICASKDNLEAPLPDVPRAKDGVRVHVVYCGS